MPQSFPCCIAALASLAAGGAGCATQYQTVVPRGDGPPLFVAADAVCRSEPVSAPSMVPGMVPDTQLCGDLVPAVKDALRGVGYRVVDTQDDPHEASARIMAQQGPDVDDRARAFLTVQVIIESAGQEVDRAAEDGSVVDAHAEKEQVQVFANELARELAHSRRMKSAGLTPDVAPATPH